MNQERADLYLALAEVLYEVPAWLARPGREWPLFRSARLLAPVSTAASGAVSALAQIEAEPLPARRARYQALFAGEGCPHCWLYESLHRRGRLLGPETEAVGQLYRQAGLKIPGSELPDHASLELSFLAYLAGQAGAEPEHARRWHKMEQQFVRKHAGRWLPELGRTLATSGDRVYAPVGRLLAEWLEEVVSVPARKSRVQRLPQVDVEACTLCAFCVQVCPTGALAIHEDASETVLLLAPERCSGCGRCVITCEPSAMKLRATSAASTTEGQAAGSKWLSLRRSTRAICCACNQPMVSQAELDFVASRLGRPGWLAYCLSCRAQRMEKDHEFPNGIPAV